MVISCLCLTACPTTAVRRVVKAGRDDRFSVFLVSAFDPSAGSGHAFYFRISKHIAQLVSNHENPTMYRKIMLSNIP